MVAVQEAAGVDGGEKAALEALQRVPTTRGCPTNSSPPPASSCTASLTSAPAAATPADLPAVPVGVVYGEGSPPAVAAAGKPHGGHAGEVRRDVRRGKEH